MFLASAKIDEAGDQLIKDLFNGTITPNMIPTNQHLEVANKLWEAVQLGFNKDLKDIKYNVPDVGFLSQLRANIFKFSAAKNYQETLELSKLLIGDDGRARSFRDFKATAKKIHNDYNINWLETEYIDAQRQAQAAAQWQKYALDKDLFDLRFTTAGDSKVSDEHRKLEGMTAPVDSPVWRRYTPPLRNRCRCDLRQVGTGGSLTDLSKLEFPKVPKTFDFNPGKERLIFNDKHPYIELLKGEGKKVARKELEAERHYGLQAITTIYRKRQQLPKRAAKFKKREDFDAWWEKEAADELKVVSAKLGKGTTVEVVVDRKAVKHISDDNKEERWRFFKDFIKTMEQPDEVYELNYKYKSSLKTSWPTYRFIKYFDDRPVISNVFIEDDKLRLVTAYESEASNNKMVNARKGILHYKKER